jgi:hypothetical protein
MQFFVGILIEMWYSMNFCVKNVLKSSPLKPVSQYSKHVIDGP